MSDPTPGPIRHVVLMGLMGSGKTTIGAMLADEIGWPFIDLDDEIVAATKRSIVAIFEEDGEAEFRRQEHEALKKKIRSIQCGQPCVISLGGGAFAQENNFELIRDNGVSFWLDVPFQLVLERTAGQDHRPLARDPEKFAALFESRKEAYARADYRIPVNSHDPKEAMKAIIALPLF